MDNRTSDTIGGSVKEGVMTSLRRWRQIGHGQFDKWETPGDELEGRWRGQNDGRYGPLGSVETPGGFVSFPLHAALFDRLKGVQQGQDVLIRYTGKQTSNGGRVFKAFEVYVAGDDPFMDIERDGSPREATHERE